jgi:threonine/homoserine/homoserine lactone efflux protein
MTVEIWLYYFLAVLLLTAAPGPSSLLCMTKAVSSGFRLSIYTALGSLTAITGILTLSFSGLGVIIASSELVFNLVKWCGAAYLFYLGFSAITSKQQSYELDQSVPAQKNSGKLAHYFSGFIVGASNPKAIIFFTALFPQFINPDHSLLEQYLLFASTFACLELSWLMLYAYLGSKSSSWLMANGRAKFFNRLTGGVFMSAAVLLSSTSRATS